MAFPGFWRTGYRNNLKIPCKHLNTHFSVWSRPILAWESKRAYDALMIEWLLTEEDNGQTVLEVLERRIAAAPPSYLRQLARRGKISRDGLPLAPDSRLASGDRLVMPGSRRLEQLLAQPIPAEVTILFENERLLVAFKPADLAVHRGIGHERDHLAGRVQALMKKRKAPFATAPIHRLDVETSGPVLFGKGRQACSALGKIFMEEDVEKFYLALVRGRIEGGGRLDSQVPSKGKIKEAVTLYHLLAGNRDWSLLELRLQSGRKHQIRRQFADAGHPLAGDRRYGGTSPPGMDRLFLHCRRLAFPDPADGRLIAVECPLPEALRRAIEPLGFPLP